MKKTKISSYLLFLSITTFAAVFFFIVQTSYTKLIGPVKEIEQGGLIKPLDPNLDTGVINQIQTRREFSPGQINLPTPTPEATPAAGPRPT